MRRATEAVVSLPASRTDSRGRLERRTASVDGHGQVRVSRDSSRAPLVGLPGPQERPHVRLVRCRRALLAALSIVCVLPAPASASASARHDRTEASIIRAMNKLRAAYSLPRLRTSGGLARAADVHSASMARSDRARARRLPRARAALRALAARRREPRVDDAAATRRRIVQMWMNSAGAPPDHALARRSAGSAWRSGIRRARASSPLISPQLALGARQRRTAYALASPCGARSSIRSRRRWAAPCSAWRICSPHRRPPTWPRTPTARGCSSTRG